MRNPDDVHVSRERLKRLMTLIEERGEQLAEVDAALVQLNTALGRTIDRSSQIWNTLSGILADEQKR